MKPTDSAPLTDIQWDGSFHNYFVSGGNDKNATKIVTYVIPVGYNPPLINGVPELPAELDSNSVAKTSCDRSP